jgi:hypothetical protein
MVIAIGALIVTGLIVYDSSFHDAKEGLRPLERVVSAAGQPSGPDAPGN